MDNIDDKWRNEDDLELSYEEKKALREALMYCLQEQQNKALEEEGESILLDLEYKDFTPIFKYMVITCNNMPQLQTKVLYGYKETKNLRNDILSRAADKLSDLSISLPKRKNLGNLGNYFKMDFDLFDEKLDGVMEIFLDKTQ